MTTAETFKTLQRGTKTLKDTLSEAFYQWRQEDTDECIAVLQQAERDTETLRKQIRDAQNALRMEVAGFVA